MNSGSKIKYYRNKINITQKKLGELSGMTSERVRAFENNYRGMNESCAVKLSNVLGCNSSDLKSYNVLNIDELKSCLMECLVVGGKDFCLDYISNIDCEIITDMRSYFMRETNEVLLNVSSEEYESAMRK